jgi:hypothetical protein
MVLKATLSSPFLLAFIKLGVRAEPRFHCLGEKEITAFILTSLLFFVSFYEV